MFADPQNVTVNAVAQTLPRVGSNNPTTVGTFKTTDGTYAIDVRQNQTANRFRREFRLTMKKVATDPISAQNKEVSASFILAFDHPKWGFTNTELGYLSAAVIAAFSNAQRDKLLGGEI